MGGAVDREGLGFLGGDKAEGAGLGDFVWGLAEIRVSTLSRDKGFLVRRSLAGRGSA